MSLSDLDLVQQAMAPTEPGAQTATSNGGSNPPPNANATSNLEDDPLAGVDLSTLSDADRAALQPIMDAIRAASTTEGEDVDVQDILKQIEAADSAADSLEGRLDKLLDSLGAMERAAEQECEEVEKSKAASAADK